jgi:hypothetical protein
MAISKDSVIKKDDIFEYLIEKDYEEIGYVKASGSFFGGSARNNEGYFWIRNNPNYFKTSDYNPLTTYTVKLRVAYDGKVYESLTDGNIDNTPDSSPDEWRLIPDGVDSGSSFYNINFRATIGGSVNSDDDYYEYTLWSVSWDGNGDEVLTQEYYNKEDLSSSSIRMSYPAGYYKYKLRSSSQGASSDTRSWIFVKRYANDIEIGKPIRVFTSDFKELKAQNTTPITAALAKAGRLTTDDYYGGDYEGTT